MSAVVAIPLRRAQLLGTVARSALAAQKRSHNHSHEIQSGQTEVAVIDPLLMLEPERLGPLERSAAAGGGPQPFIKLSVPHRLLPQLSQGQLELAEFDEPGSHLYFGKRGELFQYTYVGRQVVISGFTSIVFADELERARSAAAEERLPRKQQQQSDRSWAAFLAHFQSSGAWPAPNLPFLFAGRVVDAEAAGVHVLKRAAR